MTLDLTELRRLCEAAFASQSIAGLELHYEAVDAALPRLIDLVQRLHDELTHCQWCQSSWPMLESPEALVQFAREHASGCIRPLRRTR